MMLGERLATADGRRTYVRTLFATIAHRYDLITRVLSYGQDRRWKRRLVSLMRPGQCRVLDLATGTGDLAFMSGALGMDVIGADLTLDMVRRAGAKRPTSGSGGRGRAAGPVPAPPRATPRFVVGDMEALPFPAASFDVVTVGYGLRNVAELPLAIAEIHRVLRPGGQLLSLDFNRPGNALVRTVYLWYLQLAGGALGWILHRDPDTYRYIPASIRRYPGAEGVARLLDTGGFRDVRHYPVLGGLMAIHNATRE